MEEGKGDTGKKSDEEIRDDFKTDLLEFISETEKLIFSANSINKEIEELMNYDMWDAFSKEVTWFFAISVGSLLWVLSNFDKFILPDGSMPIRNIYISSIVFFGLSSILLAIVQGLLYWYQHKTFRSYANYKANSELYIKELNNCTNHFNEELKKLASSSTLESYVSSHKYPDSTIKSAEDLLEPWEQSLLAFRTSFLKLYSLSSSQLVLLPAVSSYIFGVVSISAYILMYMLVYVQPTLPVGI